jgi:hypothetical protein
MNIEHVSSKIVQWHHDRNLIKGATDWSQTEKLLEEFAELVASQMTGSDADHICATIESMLHKLLINGRIKPVKQEDAEEAKLDAIGDMNVVMSNIAERNGSSLETCMTLAYNEIKDRTGKMINGTFVKESDLSQ